MDKNSLRSRRNEFGLTQREVAARPGLKDHGWICRWESGRVLPSLSNAFRLAILYRATIEELFPSILEAAAAREVGFQTTEDP